MINISEEEISNHIDWLSSIQDGDEAGTTRLLYSPSWVDAVNQLDERFKELGAKVEYDKVGNLFATIEGSEEPETIIATGSHIDTVVQGGPLDGQLGVLAAYLSVKHLIEEQGQPKKSLRIVVMAEEEGSRFPYAFWGSKNIVGEADVDDVIDIEDSNGVKFVDAMKEAGFELPDGELKFNDMDAWIELHIEQGNYLENNDLSLGVVNSIAGQKRYTVTLTGQANHAGTTMMAYRHDVVDGFSHIASHALDKAREEGDPLVLTFGRVDVQPNVVNVVPGKLEFSIDCRHTDQGKLDEFTGKLEDYMKQVAEERGLEIEIDNWMNEAPVPMDEKIVDVIESVAKENDFSFEVMHSGAGHDSQILAQYFPSAMIFVPSINGVSHNPEEWTEISDIKVGIEALAGSLYQLAYEN